MIGDTGGNGSFRSNGYDSCAQRSVSCHVEKVCVRNLLGECGTESIRVGGCLMYLRECVKER